MRTTSHVREKLFHSQIRIEAYDLGTPTPLSSDLDLMIYVRNINDYEPQFQIDVFHVNFTEERSHGAESAQLPETIDRDEVDDLDDPPTQVCYFIVGGNDEGYFSLDIKRHILSVSSNEDFFLLFMYYFLVDKIQINFFQHIYRLLEHWIESNERNTCY